MLLTQARRGAEPDGDVSDLLVAVFYLLHHDLVAPGDFAGLIDEAIAAVNSRHPHPSAVRDLVFAAHSYCVNRAAEGLGSRGETYDLWLARAQRLLDIAADASFGLEFGSRLAGMRARQLDVPDDARRAADAFAEFLAAAGAGGAPDIGTTVWAALSEATLRLEIGEYQRVLERLGPLTDELLDRYLTAVTDADVGRTGFAHGQAVSLLTSALVHLDEAEAAFRVIDTGKSARLRYRAALRQHPDRERILALERDPGGEQGRHRRGRRCRRVAAAHAALRAVPATAPQPGRPGFAGAYRRGGRGGARPERGRGRPGRAARHDGSLAGAG